MAEAALDVQKVIGHIRRHEDRFRIFRGVTDTELEALLGNARTSYQPGEKILFRKGQPADEMFIILQGRVDIVDTYKNRHKVIATLGEGEAFGEVGLLLDHLRTASAKTHGAVLMLVLDEESLMRIAHQAGGPVLIMNLLRLLSERLDSMTHKYMKAKYGQALPDSPVSRWID